MRDVLTEVILALAEHERCTSIEQLQNGTNPKFRMHFGQRHIDLSSNEAAELVNHMLTIAIARLNDDEDKS